MNDPTSPNKSSIPSKSNRAERARKREKASAEGRVKAQLAGREVSGEAENKINYDGTSHETTPAEPACVEQVVSLPVQSVKTSETLDEITCGANRKMMSKLRRAYRKAGKFEASETEIRAFLTLLLEAGVPILDRSSSRICRVVKGEKSIESLLLARVRPKSA